MKGYIRSKLAHESANLLQKQWGGPTALCSSIIIIVLLIFIDRFESTRIGDQLHQFIINCMHRALMSFICY